MDTKVIGGSRRIYESENFIRTYSLSPDSLAENMKIYLLELFQVFVREKDGRMVTDFDWMPDEYRFSTEWGEIKMTSIEDFAIEPPLGKSGRLDFIFAVPASYFRRSAAIDDVSIIMSALIELRSCSMNYRYETEHYNVDGGGNLFSSVSVVSKRGKDGRFSILCNRFIIEKVLGNPERDGSFDRDVAVGIEDPFAKRLCQALSLGRTPGRFVIPKSRFLRMFNLSRSGGSDAFEKERIPLILESLGSAGLNVSFSSGVMKRPGSKPADCFCFEVVRDAEAQPR
jgi:hypothetical protein